MKIRTFLKAVAAYTLAGIASVSAANAQVIPLDFTINFQNYVNKKNGVAGTDSQGFVTAPVKGDLSLGSVTQSLGSVYKTTAVNICSKDPVWAPNPGGSGFSAGEKVLSGGDGSVVTITSVDGNGSVTGISTDIPGTNAYDPTGLSTNSYRVTDPTHTKGSVCLTPTATKVSLSGSTGSSLGSLLTPDLLKIFPNPAISDFMTLSAVNNANYISIGSGSFPTSLGDNLTLPGYYKGSPKVVFVNTLGVDSTTIPRYKSSETDDLSFAYAGHNYPTLSIDANLPTVTVGRYDTGEINNTAPMWRFALVNDDPLDGNGWVSLMNKTNVEINTIVSSRTTGPTKGLSVVMQDDGNGGYPQQNYPFSVNLFKTGLSWDWAISDSITETGGVDYSSPDRNAGGNSPVEFEGEHNLNGVGYDTKQSVYGATSYRVNQLASTGIYSSYVPFWSANTKFSAKHMIRVVDSSTGKQYLYTTDTGGTTSSTMPTFTYNETTAVSDGTVSWTYLGELTYQTGIGFQASTSCANAIDYPSGYSGKKVSYCAQMGTGFFVNANIYGTAFDASNAKFIQPGAHAWARTQKDSYLDFTANGTLAGLDGHLLGFNSSTNGLEYNIKKDPTSTGSSESWFAPLRITDDGVSSFWDIATPAFSTDTASISTRIDGMSTIAFGNTSQNAGRFNPHGEFSATVQNTSLGYFGNDYTNPNIMSWITYNTGNTNSGFEWWNFSSSTNDGPHKLAALNPTGFFLTVNTPLFSVYNKSSLDNGAITTDGNGNITANSFVSPAIDKSTIAHPVEGQNALDSTNHVVWTYLNGSWVHALPITTTFSALPATGAYVGEEYFCTDCISKLREDGDSQTGIKIHWNGKSFRDSEGIAFTH